MPLDSTRDRILAAAEAVFAAHDFHRAQVSEVATRAGVGKGTVYLYFQTKDDLHQGAIEASLRRLAEELEERAAADVPLERALRDVVLSILRYFWKRPQLLMVVQRYEVARGRRAPRNRALAAVERLLTAHRLGGAGAGRRLSAAFLLGLARAGILHHGPTDKPEGVAQRIVQAFLHGIDGAPPARRNGRRP